MPLRTGLGLSKRRYINIPAQEKPQEAQTLELFISETQFVYIPYLRIATYPLANELAEMAISPKRQNEGILVSFPVYLQA